MKKFFLSAALLWGTMLQADGYNGGCCGEAVFAVDYLFWQAEQTGMTYAIGGSNPIFSEGGPIGDTKDFHQKFEWSSGFRLGLGYDFPSCLGLNFSWTRYHNKVSASESAPIIIATELLDINGGFFLGGTAVGGTTRSRWNLDFDMLDLDLGTCLYNSCRFSFSPYLGLKGGWIHQSQKIFYNSFLGNEGGISFRADAVVNEFNRFSGVGPKIGFASDYHFFRSLSLVGNFSTAFLYGFANHPATTLINNLDTGGGNQSHFDYHQHKIMPTAQILIGLQWDSPWCSCYDLGITIAYELQYFWDTWRDHNSRTQVIFITDAGYGSLMFQGVTAELALRF